MRDLKKDLMNQLRDQPQRLLHVINVALICKSLAQHYGLNEEVAFMAGLLHDYSKHESNEFHQKYIDSKTFDELSKATHLYHAHSAANYLKEKHQISDELYVAIKNHVYGFPKMDLITQILYIADSIYLTGSRNTRKYYQIALNNLDEATYLISNYNIENVLKKDKKVANEQQLTYNYYKDVTI